MLRAVTQPHSKNRFKRVWLSLFLIAVIFPACGKNEATIAITQATERLCACTEMSCLLSATHAFNQTARRYQKAKIWRDDQQAIIQRMQACYARIKPPPSTKTQTKTGAPKTK